MTWQGGADAPPSVRIAALAPSLQRTEQRVVEAIAADRGGTVERTAQELADTVGVGRATVIRAAQSLGYDGYPQLRVALVQELAFEASRSEPRRPAETTGVQGLRERVSQYGSRLGDTMSALTDEAVEAFIGTLDSADRVLVIANGLSSPLGLDLVLRLNAAGRPAEHFADAMAQQIAARQLGAGSACVVFSGSGANRTTLEAMAAARTGGAAVLAITSFARSAAAEAADVVLVVPPVNEGFRDELIHTSRAALMLLTEQLLDLFIAHRGERGREARATALSVLGGSLQE